MIARNVIYIACIHVALTFYLQTLLKGKNYFSMGALYKSSSCKESVPASEPQRTYRRVTCWADVTLGAVILENL